MADVTLTYKGSTIAEMDTSGSKTLKTAGKYCEGDIGVSYVKPSGGGGSTDNEDAIISRTITSYSNPRITSLGEYALSNCSMLTSVDFPLVTKMGISVFSYSNSLVNINLPLLATMDNNAFAFCTGFSKLSLPCITNISSFAFMRDSNLITLILSNYQMCTLTNKNAFNNTPIASGTGYIYVPQALLEDYKTATNWVTYAAQFRTIEDYPDICGEVST